ncbi:MAG: metallophosphoesterase family protein [Hyphomicrobiaceae bacterium]|nr:metallophosphoesterase family protein [Hyphomicrobiaceae bacterium]
MRQAPLSKIDLVLRPPVLVYGGPYSNLRALTALRERADELGIPASHVICTGDVVAYGAEPEETAAAVRAWGCHVVAGNCEAQLATAAEDCACGFEQGSECDRLAKGWYPFAKARISAESRSWMGGLPGSLTALIGDLCVRVIHGGVTAINRFVFASQRGVIAEELEHAQADVVVAGHAGLAFIERIGNRVWFNPGAIGMPANDGTPDTWYGLIGAEDNSLLFSTRRLHYDHQAAAAAMMGHAYANGYARALVTGLWPSLDVLPPAERAATGQRLHERTVRVLAAAPTR